MNTSQLHLDSVLDQTRENVLFRDLQVFNRDYYLAGGTALALQLNHRKSYDFDLFSPNPITDRIRQVVVDRFGKEIRFTLDISTQLTWMTPDGVKITLTQRPDSQAPLYPLIETEYIPIQSVDDIASDKAFVIGRRGEWRDYVDIYYCLKSDISMEEMIADAKKRYAPLFEERLFLEQLAYFEDLDKEAVDFVHEIDSRTIQRHLTEQVKNYIDRYVS